jgi:hypothetical protein
MYHSGSDDSYHGDEETQILLEDQSSVKENRVENGKMNWRVRVFFTVVICAVAASLLVSGYVSGTSKSADVFSVPNSERITLENLDETCTLMSIVATNEYGVFTAPYPFFVNSEVLVEPYKNTSIAVSIPSDLTVEELGLSFEWIIGHNNMVGSNVSLTLYDTGATDIVIHLRNASNAKLCTYFSKAYVKYVKRELRSLTVEDREKMLDAVSTLWKYSQADGEERYGANYTSIQTLVEEHASASNDIMCDQFHDGTGFLTHHLALGLAFEASVRTVDPSVTIPYWDFTIDGEAIHNMNGDPSALFDVAPFFSADWFGSVDPDQHIADGRWAHSSIPLATLGKDVLTRNSYGLVRSYWNNNPDLEISRKFSSICGVEPKHKAIPRCQTHFDVLDSIDLSVFQTISPSDGHGPLHVQLGGIWGGCEDDYAALSAKWGDLLDSDVSESELAVSGQDAKEFYNRWGKKAQRRVMVETSIIGEMYTIYRSLWRSHVCAADRLPGYLVCPESCELDQDCPCSVTALTAGNTTTDNLRGCMITKDNVAYFDAVFPDEFMDDLITFVATTSVVEGDMIESASSADPLFWFIHPVLERLLQAKRNPAVLTMGNQSFYKWEQVDGNNQEFMEWSYYNFEAETMPFYQDAYTCPGHLASSPVLPEALRLTPIFYENGADIDGDGVISNMEFYLALDPSNPEKNDYVFDNFEWNHC